MRARRALSCVPSGTLGAIIFTTFAIDTGDWTLVAPYLAAAFGTIALGYDVGHRHSQVSALFSSALERIQGRARIT